MKGKQRRLREERSERLRAVLQAVVEEWQMESDENTALRGAAAMSGGGGNVGRCRRGR